MIMLSQKDLNILDDYISNRLCGEDRTGFESELAKNPELAREFAVQSEIAEAVRQTRATELKGMLNRVTVPTAKPVNYLRISAGAVAILLTGGLLWYYLSPGPGVENAVPPAERTIQNAPESGSKQTHQSVSAVPAEPTKEKEESKPARPREVQQEARQETAIPPDPFQATRPDVFVPEDETDGNTKPSTEPSTTGNPMERRETSITAEVVTTNRKLNFHYDLNGDDLVLYGSFDRSLYEIMEFFSGERRTVFLFYKNNYYLLKEEKSRTIKPLVPVNDPALLQKLREYRSK